jgi:hypothetical protein
MRIIAIVSVTLALLNPLIKAQEKNCTIVAAMARMARASTAGELLAQKPQAKDSYGARAVFAVRQFELMPENKDAGALLLSVIPRNDDQQNIWMYMPAHQCDGELEQDQISLSIVEERLARDLARAAILVPEKMQDYVWYAAEAVQDPHSDYAIQMQKVCRARHAAFAKAVEQLGEGSPETGDFATASADWFRKHILNPESCRALTFPEAD